MQNAVELAYQRPCRPFELRNLLGPCHLLRAGDHPGYSKQHFGTLDAAAAINRHTDLAIDHPAFEIGFFLYFSYLVMDALVDGAWLTLPFLALFQVGFFMVAYGSLRQFLPKFIIGGPDPDAAVGA